MHPTTVAVDLAKTVFELAIADRQWRITGRRRCSRRSFARFLATAAPTHVVMEACGTAHYWGRCAQEHGHTVSLLPPAYVRPYVRRNKTDRTDAAAILEAVRSGEIPIVPVKRSEQQALVALHRVRAQWMRTRTARLNALRGLLREHGILLPAGPRAALHVGNIAPPGWEQIYGPLVEACNLEHGWSRPDDPALAREQQPGHCTYIEAAELRAGIAHQTDPRDQIRDYLLRGVERGTVQDRAGVVAGPPTRRR